MNRQPYTINHACERSGFTLIEMVGVLVVIVILAGLMMPMFVNAQREARLRASTRRLLAVLNLARSMAIAEKTRARVEIDSRHGVFGVMVERESQPTEGESSGHTTREGGKRVFISEMSSLGRAQSLPQGVTVEAFVKPLSVSRARAFVTFYEDGRADPVVLLLRDRHGGECTMTVDPMTGRTQLGSADKATGDRGQGTGER